MDSGVKALARIQLSNLEDQEPVPETVIKLRGSALDFP
jgi:hypothetical protein